MSPHSPSRVASLAGRSLARAFENHRETFLEITRRAPMRFQAGDFRSLRLDVVERIDLYRASVDQAVDTVTEQLKERLTDRSLWRSMKAVFSALIADRDDWEIAETFFNSVTRRIFATHGVDPLIEFVDSDFGAHPGSDREPVYRTFSGGGALEGMVGQVLEHYRMRYPGDASKVAELTRRLEERLRESAGLIHAERIEVLDAPFYRGPRMHLVARVFSRLTFLPLVIVARRGSKGAELEAALLHESDVSILFSFTRAYFHVDAPRPSQVVRFLRAILPRKRTAELYNAIGCDKHGKTEFYRELLAHLHGSLERFDFAPGTPGLVMAAFFLPGYDVVFKIIRDRFRPPKVTSREKVIERYQFVKRHDRAGRLVEAQDFEHLAFRRERFGESLMKELDESCTSSVRRVGDQIVLSHLYVERQVMPLNLFLRQAAPSAAREAVLDFGQAIKDLAYTGVFTGDLLTKNFGVTRNGRVVFYDYDELVHLEECNFRTIPPPRSHDDEMAAEPWYRVAENDIFPEELRTFIGLSKEWLPVFEERHGDLFTAEYWWEVQQAWRQERSLEVQPFSHRCLL